MKKHLSLIFLYITVFLAAISRFSSLLSVPVSLFSDEVDIGYQVKSLWSTGKDYQGNAYPLQFHSFSDVRTALPIYATALVGKIPGISLDLAIRLTPAIFSVLTIFLSYFLVNELFNLFFNKSKHGFLKPGLWFAVFLTVLPWHFTYSRTGFELSMLFFVVFLGLYSYVIYLKNNKNGYYLLSLFILSLIPLIYSTAKLSVLFVPFILAALPGSVTKMVHGNRLFWIPILFLPLLILFINGGAAKRFNEISIFTDPTIATQTDFARKSDLGPNAQVGSSPSVTSRVAHNKVILVLNSFVRNLINPVSSSFLFIQGDTNPRHAVQNWGMLPKILLIPLLVGIFYLFSTRNYRALLFLLFFGIAAIVPASLTRDGWNHSSRLFLLILPLVFLSAVGMDFLGSKSKVVVALILLGLICESFLYFHSYFRHYLYDSERDWHAGMKEMVLYAKNHPDKNIVMTRRYEPPLIFYLYYTDYSPSLFQKLARANTFHTDIDPKLNLEGVRFSDSNVYFASIKDAHIQKPFVLSNAVYVLTRSEMNEAFGSGSTLPTPIVVLPSGEPFLYAIDVDEATKSGTSNPR